jgi:hypothetical protein
VLEEDAAECEAFGLWWERTGWERGKEWVVLSLPRTCSSHLPAILSSLSVVSWASE